MTIVIVEAVAPMASWRPPEALTYHRTLPLPPYTALVGLLGASQGLGLPETYRFVADKGLRLGVGGWHNGKARDLWKFQKLKDKGVGGAVLLRELWIDTRLVFVVEAPARGDSELIAEGFRCPAYPLTAGPSDALLCPLAVRTEEAEPVATRTVVSTMVYGEISPNYRPFDELRDLPLTHTVQAPSVENLPTGFDFGEDGERRLAGRAKVSFVMDPIELAAGEAPVNGYNIAPVAEPFRQEHDRWKEKGLQWTIPVHRYD